jgi:hypothetical protein
MTNVPRSDQDLRQGPMTKERAISNSKRRGFSHFLAVLALTRPELHQRGTAICRAAFRHQNRTAVRRLSSEVVDYQPAIFAPRGCFVRKCPVFKINRGSARINTDYVKELRVRLSRRAVTGGPVVSGRIYRLHYRCQEKETKTQN